MYESFYGFSAKPFQLNPDPAFYYGSKEHRRAMAYLEYGVHKGEGFIVVTGEVGAGKTTVVRNLLNQLDSKKVVAAQLVTSQLNAEDTLRMVSAAFGLPVKDLAKSEVLLSMEAFFVKLRLTGRRALLVIDEAQNLTPQAMEELRMLSNYQLEDQALLQSFLVGQPEFRRMLEDPHMQQLRQRVIAGCHISPMDADECRCYIEHRLTQVGWKHDPDIKADAHQALFEMSGGIPRRINSLCDRLLLSGYLESKHVLTGNDVLEAAREFGQETRMPESHASDPTQPINGSAAVQALEAFDVRHSDIDAGKLEIDADTVHKASMLISSLEAGGLEERIARLERTNAAAMTVLRHLLNAVQARPPERKE